MIGWEEPLTVEEQWREGAMGPADFLAHYEKTKGRAGAVPASTVKIPGSAKK